MVLLRGRAPAAPAPAAAAGTSTGCGGSMEPRSKYAISNALFSSVKSMTFTPPWYQPCTYRSRPGTGMIPPLCDTQFSSADCADGNLKYAFCDCFFFASREMIVLPPSSIMLDAWHI